MFTTTGAVNPDTDLLDTFGQIGLKRESDAGKVRPKPARIAFLAPTPAPPRTGPRCRSTSNSLECGPTRCRRPASARPDALGHAAHTWHGSRRASVSSVPMRSNSSSEVPGISGDVQDQWPSFRSGRKVPPKNGNIAEHPPIVKRTAAAMTNLGNRPIRRSKAS